jgi:hypothetical protein
MTTEVRKEMLVRTVGSVFITMLGLDVTPSTIPWRPVGKLLASYVQLSGDWNGAVLLQCTRRQACRFAGLILSTPPPETVDDNERYRGEPEVWSVDSRSSFDAHRRRKHRRRLADLQYESS